MWQGLKGTTKYRAGTSGTETFTSGARILQVHAFSAAGGSITFPARGSPTNPITITLPAGAWWGWQPNHAQHTLEGTGTALQLVFTSTTSYFIEYTDPAGTS